MARHRARDAAALTWDSDPISGSRLFAELWNVVKNEDWAFTSPNKYVGDWQHRLWPMEKHYQYIGDSGGAGKMILMNALIRLERADARELASPAAKWTESGIATAIKETLQALPQLSDAIAASYFAHSAISRTGRGEMP